MYFYNSMHVQVIYCAGARTSFMVDQKLVSEHGVQMIAKAFQVCAPSAASAQ